MQSVQVCQKSPLDAKDSTRGAKGNLEKTFNLLPHYVNVSFCRFLFWQFISHALVSTFTFSFCTLSQGKFEKISGCIFFSHRL